MERLHRAEQDLQAAPPLRLLRHHVLDCFSGCEGGSWVRTHYLATTMSDPVPPTLGDSAGSLLEPGVRRGRQTVSIRAHDQGGGISEVALLVNGLPAAPARIPACAVAQTQNNSVAGTVAAEISPCPAEIDVDWTLDSASYPFRTGANSVQVCASDFATIGEPNKSCSVPRRSRSTTPAPTRRWPAANN